MHQTMSSAAKSKTLIEIDLSESPYKNDMIHNRWHPDVPIVAWVKRATISSSRPTTGPAASSRTTNPPMTSATSISPSLHFLSGPIGVEGAEPGDLLVVDLLDVGALPESSWGFNGFFSKKNGGGFLTDHFPLAQKSIWDISGMYTHSRHVPGVNFAGLIHPGLIGCLPDQKLLDTWNARETALIATDPDRVPPLAAPPFGATRACRTRQRRRQGEDRGRGRAHRAAARARRQLRHQGISRADRRSISRSTSKAPGSPWRPALQPGRRRDHLLRRHRDGRAGCISRST